MGYRLEIWLTTKDRESNIVKEVEAYIQDEIIKDILEKKGCYKNNLQLNMRESHTNHMAQQKSAISAASESQQQWGERIHK